MDAAQPGESTASGGDRIPAIRVFVSSPGDVPEERSTALTVLQRIQGHFKGQLVLVPILWEQEPLLASAGFQQEIDRRAPPSASDIALFILHSRLGTPLSRHFVLDDGTRPTGTEWEFHDALRACRNRQRPHILVYRKSADAVVSLQRHSREERRERERQFEAVEAFFTQQFRDEQDLSFTGSYHSFETASEFGVLLDAHLRKELHDLLQGAAPAPILWNDPAFLGLATYDTEHASVFFGRTRAIQAIRQALSRQARCGRAFVLIIGPSGNGKSSLARAGILPMLVGPWVVEEDVRSGFCKQAAMIPAAAQTPLEALARALVAPEALPDLGFHGDAGQQASIYAESPQACVSQVVGALNRLAERKRAKDRLDDVPQTRLVLLVDQLEDLFTREGVTDADRLAFARVIAALARSGRVYVIGTLRSDFYREFAALDPLMRLKDDAGHYDLAPVDAAEVGQIVRGPAQVAGLAYEFAPERGEGLDDVLVREAAAQPDALPLLSYLLSQLEERRMGNVLTFSAHDALGGLEGAIATRAEEEWAALSPSARDTFPSVLRAMVELGAAADPRRATKRWAPRQEIESTPAAAALVDRFVRARLFVTRESDAGPPVIAVAHEALLRRWDRAQEQIKDDAPLLRIRSRVRSQSARWDSGPRERGLLLPEGKPLDEARLLRNSSFALTQTETEFIEASMAKARRSALLRRGALVALLLLAIASATLAIVWEQQRQRAAAVRSELRASELVTASAVEIRRDPMLALLLARDALRRAATTQATAQMREALRASRERATFRGHARAITDAVFSPDGEYVLTVSGDPLLPPQAPGVPRWAKGDGTARLWDLQGKTLAVLKVQDKRVQHAAFASGGTRILTVAASWPGMPSEVEKPGVHEARPAESSTARERAEPRREFPPRHEPILIPSGRLRESTATVGEAPSAVDIYGPPSPGPESPDPGSRPRIPGLNPGPAPDPGIPGLTPGHVPGVPPPGGVPGIPPPGGVPGIPSPGPVPGVLPRPRGRSPTTVVHLWDLEGRLLRTLCEFKGEVTGAHLLTVEGDRVLLVLLDGSSRALDLNADQLATALDAVETKEALEDFEVDRDRWRRSDANPDGPRGFAGPDGLWSLKSFGDGRAELLTPDEGSEQEEKTEKGEKAEGSEKNTKLVALLHGHVDPITVVRSTGDGKRVLTASEDGTARLWDLHGRVDEAVTLSGHEHLVHGAAFSPDGREIVTWSCDGTVHRWDLTGRQVLSVKAWEYCICRASLSPDGSSRILWQNSLGPVGLCDIGQDPPETLWKHDEDYDLRWSVSPGSQVECAAFSFNGGRVVTAFAAGTIHIRNLNGEVLHELQASKGIPTVAFSPDGRFVLILLRGDVLLWEPGPELSGRVIGTYGSSVSGIGDRLIGSGFFPDGSRLFAGVGKGVVRIWTTDGLELATVALRGLGGMRATVQLSPDGKRFLTGSDDGTVRLWDLEGRQLAILARHEEAVRSACLSPNGRHLVTVSSGEKTARVWSVSLSPTDLLDLADERILRDYTPAERANYASLLNK